MFGDVWKLIYKIMSNFFLFLAIVAYIATILISFRSFKRKKYGFYFDIIGSFFLSFSFDYLKFMLKLNWFYSLALPGIVYFITLVVVKKIANASSRHN